MPLVIQAFSPLRAVSGALCAALWRTLSLRPQTLSLVPLGSREVKTFIKIQQMSEHQFTNKLNLRRFENREMAL